MELEVSSITPEEMGTPLMVHLLASGQVDRDPVLDRLDTRMKGALRKQLEQERFAGKPEQRVQGPGCLVASSFCICPCLSKDVGRD